MAALPVAVVGASGSTGKRVVDALLHRGAEVVAVSRHPAASDRKGVETRHADLRRPDSLRDALAGTSATYLIPPTFQSDETALMAEAAEASSRAGTERVVLHSVLHAYCPTMHHHVRKANSEDAVRRTASAWTILQPAMYVQTVTEALLRNETPDGVVPVPWSVDSRFTPVHLGDVAEVAATVLTEPGHEFASYELAGPRAMSTAEMVQTCGAVAGRALHARPVDIAAVLPYPAGSAEADTLIAMCREYDQFGLLGNGRVLGMLLGRPATSFEEACRQDLADREPASPVG